MPQKLIVLFGPSAVGKMTVGQAIADRTGLRLFHNHLSIELIFPFFEFDTPQFKRLNTLIRTELLREVAESDLPGLVFTFVWALNEERDHEYVAKLIEPFTSRDAAVYYVELEAEQAVRLQRNQHPDRLAAKPTKRDTERSEKVLLYHDEHFRFNSLPDEFAGKRHLRINNTHLSAGEVAEQVVQWMQSFA